MRHRALVFLGSGLLILILVAGASLIGPQPEVFAPGVISDAREQYRITFTPSGDTAYFAAGDGFFPQTRQASIYRSVRVDGAWQPASIASFSGTYPDIDPFVTPDGRRLFFSSIRQSGDEAGDVVDLWVMDRDGSSWGQPQRIPIEMGADALYPSVDGEGVLYFASPIAQEEGPSRWHIFAARPTLGGYTTPEPLPGGVNVEGLWSFNPAVSADGRRLVFTRLNPADARASGFGELYVSFYDGEQWSEARTLGPTVNTPADEYHPSFSPDDGTLFFVRRDPFSVAPNGDLHYVATAGLDMLRDDER